MAHRQMELGDVYSRWWFANVTSTCLNERSRLGHASLFWANVPFAKVITGWSWKRGGERRAT